MAEWSIAAVLKTVEVRASGGSNPSLSALSEQIFARFFLFTIHPYNITTTFHPTPPKKDTRNHKMISCATINIL